MKSHYHFLSRMLMGLLLCCLSQTVAAQSRRPIDSRHPLWMIHIDVWSLANPQAIIDMIPQDIRPYVCMNLSLSCQYDTKLNIYKKPQDGVATLKSWATVCQHNGMWFTCQPASGGHTHIQDSDLNTFEYFFKTYPNFLGWNYAEQFWGFDEQGDKSSSTQTSRIALFAKLVKMSHQYGGFLTVSFCGNMWSHGLSPLGMLKRNSDLLSACEKYPEAILWLYKYTQSGCYYNSESVTWGPYIAGLANNYGVRYDRCGWDADKNILAGTDKNNIQYPLCAGVSTVMEQTCVNGGAVWDGPETIPTECISVESDTQTSDGYMRHNWNFFPGFKNVWIDMWRKVIDGTLYIPTRAEVLGKTKIVVINDINSGSDENKYAGWQDLYDGLYKQDDPYNCKAARYQTGDGDFMNNLTWFKKTGRYGAIPVVPELYDNLAKTIPVQKRKSAKWSSISAKQNDFNAQYASVSTGDLYVNRYRNQLITYTPYSYFNKKRSASATIPLQYNTCKELKLTWGELSSGAIREYADHINFYLNNYRTDTTTLVTDLITVTGAKSKPSYSYTVGTGSVSNVSSANTPSAIVANEKWNASTGTYTIEVRHCGSVNLKLSCSGNETWRRTDYLPSTRLATPQQPQTYTGSVMIEAEDMDYRSIQECSRDPYYNHQSERGHHGIGFVIMGTNTNGSLRYVFNSPAAKSYRGTLRYMNTDKKGNIRLTANGQVSSVACETTNNNEWKTVSKEFSFQKGNNSIVIDNINGINLWLDQMELSPVSTSSTTGSSNTSSTDNLVKAWSSCNDFVPEGWTVVDDGNEIQSGNHSSGPRVMQFYQGGDMAAAFYVRQISANKAGYIEYGGKNGYTLPLVYGEYQLNCQVAAWKGSPYLKVEVFDPSNAVIASTIVKSGGCVNGTRNATISGSTQVALSFYSMTKGNYKLRFTPVADAQGNGGYWQEALVGNVGLYYKGNPLVFKNANTVPEGWNILDAGQKVSAGTAVSGPRIFKFGQSGYLPTGLYVRQSDASKPGYAEVGTTDGYGISLKQGTYNLSYYAIGWAGTPYIKCEVFDESNHCLGSQTIQCANNVGKNLNTSTYGVSYGAVNFYASHTGYYHFRWTPVADANGNSGTWLEVVFGHIKIQQGSASAKSMAIGVNDGTTTGIDTAVESKGKPDVWYNLQGQRVSQPARGIYIHNGKKVVVK